MTPDPKGLTGKRWGMAENGVLIIGSHNVSWSIKGPEMKRISAAYEETFSAIKDGINYGSFSHLIVEEAATVAPLRKT